MNNKLMCKCLLEMADDARTTPIMLDRIKSIGAELSKIAGVLKGITPERMKRNPSYWSKLLEGWGDRLQILNTELKIINVNLTASQLQ